MLTLKAVLLIRITRQVEETPNTLKNYMKIFLIVLQTKRSLFYALILLVPY